jgi:hypothetical protein
MKHVGEMNTLLAPLRSFFLKKSVEYVRSQLCPGSEWLVNLILLLCIWNRAGSGAGSVTNEEIKVSMND